MNRLIIVTGATGHLGLNLIHQLLALGDKVRALVLPHDPLAHCLPPVVEQCQGSITSAADIEHLFENVSTPIVVIHCAGIVSIQWKYSPLVHQVNVEGTRLLIDYLLQHPVERFIYVSSVHAISENSSNDVLKEPTRFDPQEVVGCYAKSKSEAAAYVLEAIHRGLPGTLVFPSGIIGPFDYAKGHTTQTLLEAAHGRLPMCVEGGYDFVDVRDVAQAITELVDHPKPQSMYILTNRYVKIQEILETVAIQTHRKFHYLCVPYWMASASLPLFQLYYRLAHQKPTFTKYSLYTLRTHTLFDHELATRDLDFHPRPIAQSLRDTLQWFVTQGWMTKEQLIKQPSC